VIRTFGFTILLAFSCVGVCRADTEADVIAAESAYATAWKRGDHKQFAAAMTDDFTYTSADGQLWTKREVVDWMKTPGFKVLSGELTDKKVRVLGRMAIFNGRWKSQYLWDGKEKSEIIRYSSVWVMRNGAWRIVNEHVTTITDP
jgi:uncharacterized protein (TIGR02246 family)